MRDSNLQVGDYPLESKIIRKAAVRMAVHRGIMQVARELAAQKRRHEGKQPRAIEAAHQQRRASQSQVRPKYVRTVF